MDNGLVFIVSKRISSNQKYIDSEDSEILGEGGAAETTVRWLKEPVSILLSNISSGEMLKLKGKKLERKKKIIDFNTRLFGKQRNAYVLLTIEVGRMDICALRTQYKYGKSLYLDTKDFAN
ncbi:Hypothetical predicted protein [Octopus vulgaris]|uniref:Uncharacterized protein n=1 Tax=Octopus vulgaris TaxID=6645 RepID=A0AA36AVT1_OCTVU|nr:Hypothetical predicted protein [Octopus vulgaris]